MQMNALKLAHSFSFSLGFISSKYGFIKHLSNNVSYKMIHTQESTYLVYITSQTSNTIQYN